MRPSSHMFFVLAMIVCSVVAQTGSAQPAPEQTARQALIEMLFGQSPEHFEKHLPDGTRETFEKLGKTNGQGVSAFFSALAAQSKTGKQQLETFDTGPMLLISKEPSAGNYEKLEITVERDDLLGNEDQIELALHATNNGKEEPLLPTILRFFFSMKLEAGVWRLNEVSATVRLPIADPAFLKAIEEHQLRQNEQMSMWSVRAVINAERSYQAAQGGFACALSTLGSASKEVGASKRVYLYDSQLAGGKKNGYNFAISECDTTHYRVVAEPEVRGSGQRSFCSDESGTLRASADGKGTTCLASGEPIKDEGLLNATPRVASNGAAAGTPLPRRVRVSQGVASVFLVSKVQPVYPPAARAARIQGNVVMKAEINQTGDVENLEIISGDPMLAPAAMDAVKQWKYRPYLLNGSAVSVETQVTVNFVLNER